MSRKGGSSFTEELPMRQLTCYNINHHHSPNKFMWQVLNFYFLFCWVMFVLCTVYQKITSVLHCRTSDEMSWPPVHSMLDMWCWRKITENTWTVAQTGLWLKQWCLIVRNFEMSLFDVHLIDIESQIEPTCHFSFVTDLIIN